MWLLGQHPGTQKESTPMNMKHIAAAALAFTLTLSATTVASAQCAAADINDNGVVDGTDLTELLSAWGTNNADADIDGSGVVGGTDLTALLASWGPCVPSVPAWATLLEAAPNPSVVTSASLRAAITATGLAWRVKDTATQVEMVLIPPGTFNMGCSYSGCSTGYDMPPHQVTLTNAFYLGRYEVTQAQWTARIGVNLAYFQSPSAQVPASLVPQRPIEQVDWDKVQSFTTSADMRLPTEAEWEYAYRAGTTTQFHGFTGYPNGTNDPNLAPNIAWISSNSNDQTRPVGGKLGNGFGLHDMAGNVEEWVDDFYWGADAFTGEPQTNPMPAYAVALFSPYRVNRVTRGGSYNSYNDSAHTAWERDYDPTDYYSKIRGFRVAKDPFAIPTLTASSPPHGSTAGGTTITLTGTNLLGTTRVTVGGAECSSVQVVNDTTVTAVTPAGSTGTREVRVIKAWAQGIASVFTYGGTPSIQSVLPASGSTAGGTQITLSGPGLFGATSVTVGGLPCTNVQSVNATTVTAVTPTGSVGVKNITLVSAYGNSTLASGYTYSTISAPQWGSLLEPLPNSSVVTSATLRNAIVATGLPWRVRDTATQIEMVLIPPGTFNMGCSASQNWGCDNNENPVHQVTLTNAFYMGRYEVTQAQWQARMGSNPSAWGYPSYEVSPQQVPQRPVENVSWNTVQGFLSQTGMRLPTEAEWEYAYRAGTTTAFHGYALVPNGFNTDSLLPAIAWIDSNSNIQTRPVGGKLGNGFGLHDMSGNVWEWVNDWYGSYSAGAQTNPQGPSSGSDRVLRGGGWYYFSSYCRASGRNNYPGVSSDVIGFRVARTP